MNFRKSIYDTKHTIPFYCNDLIKLSAIVLNEIIDICYIQIMSYNHEHFRTAD